MSVNLTGSESTPKDNIIRGYEQPLTGSLSDVNINSGSSGGASAPTGTRLSLNPLSALADIFTATMNYIGVKDTNKTNLKLAREQNEFNLNQWNRENEYNSPYNQMKRYQAAGLNPLLAMADIEPGQAPQLQSAPLANQVPFTGWPNLSDALINAFNANVNQQNADTNEMIGRSNVSFNQAQIANLQVQNNKLNKEFDLLCKELTMSDLKIDRQTTENLYYELYGDDVLSSEAAKNLAEAGYKEKEIEHFTEILLNKTNEARAAVKNADTQAELAQSTINLNKKISALYEEEARTERFKAHTEKHRGRVMKLDADNYYLNQGIKLIKGVGGAAGKVIKVKSRGVQKS